MKAMTISNFGLTDEFELVDVPTPEITSGHVLVRVMASSVNPVDLKIREFGTDLPFAPELPAILGMDFAGVIAEVGEGVSDFSIGDEVYGCAGGLGDLAGSLAEYILADARLIARKPKNLTMQQAAALPLVSITAYEGLTRANVQPGQKILVHGGSGGVGHVALQLAKYWQAEVYATGGGQAQLDLIRNLGATAINYKTESVEDYVNEHTDGRGFDVIFDSVGAENLTNSMNAAALNAQIATTVSMVEIDLTLAHIKGLTMHVVFMLIPMIHNIKRESHGKILQEVANIVEDGGLIPVLSDQQFELATVSDAHDYQRRNAGMGKVTVTIND